MRSGSKSENDDGVFYKNAIKPLVDRVMAGFGMVILLQVFCVIGAAIRLRMGSPVIFRQKRIGLMESPFEFIKFRTMRDDRDEVGKLLPDEARLSKFGMFLRSSSLDELPQLWSVVTGDMSLIGPRPLLPEYLPLYSKSQKRRHCVKPGITGLAQVMGRNAISWKEKLDLDVYYVDHYDWRLDLKIVWLTVASVVRREGISRNGHATSPPFTGSE